MIKLNIKPEDRQAIKQGRYSQPHPRVMQKYDALRMKDCGASNKFIYNILRICNNTLLSIFKQYNEGGLEKLQEINFYHPQSDLKAFSGRITKYFEETPPGSISEAAAKIEELTGIKRSETQVRKFLKDMNFRFRRVGTVPAKVLTEGKKRAKKIFRARVSTAFRRSAIRQTGCLSCRCSAFCLWCIYCLLMAFTKNICSGSFGRNRYNVLGSINAVSYDLLTGCNTIYINALSVCELFEAIALMDFKKTVPITLVLDNVRYQHCKYVQDKAKELGIELLFLLSYNPNLNLIERLRIWTKKDCLN
ncbi:MAG: transposase [Prevotellaceae bacterium]|jgi:hypothetical protein|nr:transposase [Prevotellaceae bacterium]